MSVMLKHLKIERPLAVIDVESTGIDPARDRIVEVAVLRFQPDRAPDLYHRLVDPKVPIPTNATRVHGLIDDDVAGAPSFRLIAGELLAQLDGADLAGFGIARFDLPLLAAEFARCGRQWPLEGRSILDALTIFHRHERRDLAAAVRRYLNREHALAHRAMNDVAVTLEVLDQQIATHVLPPRPADLHAMLIDVDVGGRFRRDGAGQTVFAAGKYQGRPLTEVAIIDPRYLSWWLSQPLLDDARSLVQQALATVMPRERYTMREGS